MFIRQLDALLGNFKVIILNLQSKLDGIKKLNPYWNFDNLNSREPGNTVQIIESTIYQKYELWRDSV